ncbi:MAG TPA: hypothetical protein VMV63_09475 [Acidithiobacillus sp.]|nr:hypothetical protein [Acidithiobacillus sp.]
MKSDYLRAAAMADFQTVFISAIAEVRRALSQCLFYVAKRTY